MPIKVGIGEDECVCGPGSEYLFCILIAVGVIELWDREGRKGRGGEERERGRREEGEREERERREGEGRGKNQGEV